ncbi:FkbM family methyltransferase [Pandoraea sp. NPDC090278]|uniref:FkbM family methyltransferase n=1 Tax=Pandoraea sp. NPDC090278 TaxID=3364391 RepID=UPI00383A5D51
MSLCLPWLPLLSALALLTTCASGSKCSKKIALTSPRRAQRHQAISLFGADLQSFPYAGYSIIVRTFIKDCRHGKFLLLNGDMISNYVNMYGEWSEAEVELFQDILSPASNVVEVGANIGMHTVPLSMICNEGKVIAYEPQRPIFHVLCGNIALNNRLNIIARNIAVGDTAEIVNIRTSTYEEPWNYGSFSVKQGFDTEGEYKAETTVTPVEVIKIDEDQLLRTLPGVDLIKIDAEGFEPEILKGAWDLITQHKPRLFIEANSEPVVRDVLQMLRAADYTAYWFISNRFRASNFNRNWFRVNGYDCNIICTHHSRPISTRHSLQPVTDFGDIARGVPIMD